MRTLLQYFILIALAAGWMQCQPSSQNGEANDVQMSLPKAEYALVIHGGAGTITRDQMTPERDAEYRKALNEALDIGADILKNGGAAIEAVETTIMYLEDNPLFNAGRGAVFTHEGKNELDAAIMVGKDLGAGAVAGLTNIKNPIRAARAVMEKSEHVFLTGKGAEQFSAEQGLEEVDPQYFFTQNRWDGLQRALQADQPTGSIFSVPEDRKMGTVGCVALDKNGELVAGTSTGGMTNKRWNRIGDVPVIGAGTYANNATCAVSCTGHGEYFIRYTVGHDVSALMEYKGVTLTQATEEVVMNKLVKAEGSGGLIAVDSNGNVAMTFNSEGMYRGYAKPGERVVGIYKDEK